MENQTVNQPTSVRYAGFWLRFVAIIIDGVILGVAQWVIIAPFFALIGLTTATVVMDADTMTTGETVGIIATLFGAAILLKITLVVLAWLYFALMESSKHQATLGKLVIGLKVTDLDGNKISFGRATGRYFGKILSGFIICIGYIMAGFTEKKQALHDILAKCLVVKK